MWSLTVSDIFLTAALLSGILAQEAARAAGTKLANAFNPFTSGLVKGGGGGGGFGGGRGRGRGRRGRPPISGRGRGRGRGGMAADLASAVLYPEEWGGMDFDDEGPQPSFGGFGGPASSSMAATSLGVSSGGGFGGTVSVGGGVEDEDEDEDVVMTDDDDMEEEVIDANIRVSNRGADMRGAAAAEGHGGGQSCNESRLCRDC